jgi:NAD(P)-dependent dehydrogenase (short-subunit alcohol dehydrogenase family)
MGTSRTVVIAGGGSGIGKAVAMACGSAGFVVALLGRTQASLEASCRALDDCGSRSFFVVADLSKEKEVEDAFGAIDGFADRIDILVNSTGVFAYQPIPDISLETWDRVISSTLTAPFLCAREAFKRMQRQRAGRIINIGSTSAKRVRPDAAAYSAAKHGIWGLTQAIALEGRAHNINCTCINPGRVTVERCHLADCDEPAMSVDEFAEVVLGICQLPDHVNLLEATILHQGQPFVGRG